MLKLEVLSGGLGGRTFQFDQTEVRLGRHPACEIAFDSISDDSVGRWHAHLRQDGTVWSVENLHENGTFLNGKPVTGKRMMQSGDSLRLARDGPEIRITIVAQDIQPAAPPPVAVHQGHMAPIPLSATPKPMLAAHALRPQSHVSTWIGVGAVGVVVVALSAVLLISRHLAHKDDVKLQPQVELGARKGTESPKPTGGSKNEAGLEPKDIKPTPRGKEPPPSDPWQEVERRNRRSVYALAAEEPNGLGIWPMGTATAVRDDLVVTTASLATQLETLRRENWKIWILGSETNSAREISNIQVHIGFVKSAEKPEQQAFFDLALLTLSAKVSEVCEIASNEEIDGLDARQPFGCLAISLPIGDPKDPPEPIGRFDVLLPELIKGKIQGLLQVSRDPGAPRMLLLPASMPSHIWGSPVLNASGRLIAVCTEAAQKTETGQVRLNYAPIVTSVADRLKSEGQEVWIAVP